MKLITKITLLLGLAIGYSLITVAQNITISGSCAQGIATLVNGGDPSTLTLNGKPVYYNSSVSVNYASTTLNAQAYLYYELAANLGTPEDRWILTFDGQPYYYFISNSASAPTGIYQPFDGSAPIANCGGTMNIGVSIPLSVQVVDVKAYMEQNNNIVEWSTLNEEHNHFFQIERSADGSRFEEIGQANSKSLNGNSSTPLNYSFTDQHPWSGHNYYRLVQYDLNGQSRVVSSVYDVYRNDPIAIQVFPNPAEDKLTVITPVEWNPSSMIQIIDIMGRMVYSTPLISNHQLMDVTSIPKGVYTVRVQSNKELKSTFRFVKR